ncbi:hypothetical protein Hdeb2414_s0021g00573841 [Helianthus debilis subsp. tardiflorus]
MEVRQEATMDNLSPEKQPHPSPSKHPKPSPPSRRYKFRHSEVCFRNNLWLLWRCRKREKWRWKVDKDDSRMRSIRMIQHITRRKVVKDYVFCFFDYVGFIVFTKLEHVIICFFVWFGKHYGTCIF